jgi:hypothetical protein
MGAAVAAEQMYLDENKDVYFAAQQKPEDVAKSIWSRKKIYERYVRDTGLFTLWRKMHWAYYGREDGTNFKTTEIGSDGPEGDLHVLKVNHLRSIITSWDSLLGNQRTAMKPKALDDDYESEMQVKRSQALLDHYSTAGSPARLEVIEADAREMACLYGAAVTVQLWNPLKGPMSVPGMDGQPGVQGGDLEGHAFSPLDFMYDPWRKDANIPWYICRLWYPRHSILARWPQFKETVLQLSPEPEGEFLDFSLMSEGTAPPGKWSFDEVPLYYFCHGPIEAEGMRAGKQGFFLNADTMLEYGDLMYRDREGVPRMNIRRIAPADIKRSPHGFSPAWELLAPQEAADTLSTIQLTNARTFGLGSMLVPDGSGIEPVQIADGLQLVPYPEGMEKPGYLETPQTSPTIPALRREVVTDMGIILGINGVVRGDPTATVDKSGSAMALLDAKAVQASAPFMRRLVWWKEESYLDTICIVRDFMSEPRQFAICGDAIGTLTEPFAGKGVNRIFKVQMESVNPLSQTVSGRMQIADTIAERFPGQIKPGDYFRLLESGNANFLTHHADQAERNIDRENQLLATGIGPLMPRLDALGNPIIGLDGQPVIEQPVPGRRYVKALIIDDHRQHVRLHRTVLENPAVREASTPQAQAVLRATLAHIDEHERMLTLMTLKRPGLLELTGQPPLQSALPPPMPMGGPPPGGMRGPSPEARAEHPEPAGGGEQPRMPSMPRNPLTGRKAPGPAPAPPQPGGVPS